MKLNQDLYHLQPKNGSWIFSITTSGADGYIPYAVHIERNDETMLVNTDEEAAKEAEKAGVPLIYDMFGIEEGIYIDTEENRQILTNALKEYNY